MEDPDTLVQKDRTWQAAPCVGSASVRRRQSCPQQDSPSDPPLLELTPSWASVQAVVPSGTLPATIGAFADSARWGLPRWLRVEMNNFMGSRCCQCARRWGHGTPPCRIGWITWCAVWRVQQNTVMFLVRTGRRAARMPRRGHGQPIDMELMAELGYLPWPVFDTMCLRGVSWQPSRTKGAKTKKWRWAQTSL